MERALLGSGEELVGFLGFWRAAAAVWHACHGEPGPPLETELETFRDDVLRALADGGAPADAGGQSQNSLKALSTECFVSTPRLIHGP